MKQLNIFIFVCLFFFVSSILNGKGKDIYLPSVITIQDRGKIQIIYDEHRRITSIHNSISWGSYYKDSTSIDIYYDKKGRIRQKYESITKTENDSIKPLFSTGSTFDYDYTKKDTIDVYVFKSTKIYETDDTYQLDTNHGKIYTDRDKEIVGEWFDKDKERMSVLKTKFNKNGTLSEYHQSLKYKEGYMVTYYSVIEYTDGKSIFENVNFVNNYNRTQLINIFLIVLDCVSKVHITIKNNYDGENNITEENSNIQYQYNEAGYPVFMEMNSEQDKNTPSICIEYIKF